MHVSTLIVQLVAVAAALVPAAMSQEQLRVGDPAPDFTLPYATRDTIVTSGLKLSEMVGTKNIVLAFYPADWSGGCTKQMCTMRDNFTALGDLHAFVYGISGDYVFSHREWARFHDLPFPLLSDHDHAVARRYASFNAKTGYNLRTVYVIDRRGTIAYMDLSYKAGSNESFERLSEALRGFR